MTVLDDGRPLVVATERSGSARARGRACSPAPPSPTRARRSAERGRSLARDGSVHTVEVAVGTLRAAVEDDAREHAVEIAAEPVPPRIWAAASSSACGNPQLEAAVAGRGQSVQLEHVMAVDWEEPLVPGVQALRRSCTCGAWAVRTSPRASPTFADWIDREPALLLRWRAAPSRPEPGRRAEPSRSSLRRSGRRRLRRSSARRVRSRRRPVLKRLGPSGIQAGAQDLAEVLERAYASFASTKRRPRTTAVGTAGQRQRCGNWAVRDSPRFRRCRELRRSRATKSSGAAASRQRLDRHDVEGTGVRCAEDDRRRDARLVRLEPAGRAQAPAVAGCSPSKPHSGRVERSLPTPRLKARNSSVITAQTV